MTAPAGSSVRLNRYVASSTALSRRTADAAIAAGRVLVNGLPVSLGTTVTAADLITLDGSPLSAPTAFTYIALNKPEGYVTSRAQQGTAPTIYDLLPKPMHKLRPAGRLDRDSSGLILLSDDGQFIYQHTHPSAGHDKRYDLSLDRTLTDADVATLARGVALPDGPSRIQFTRTSIRRATVLMQEGRNRQLRRTFGALGYRIHRLHRTAVGHISLGSLPLGKWRRINPKGSHA